MYRRLSEIALALARVPAEPQPPSGAPGSVRVFRAGRNHYYLRLIRWGATQIGAVVGVLFSVAFVSAMHLAVEEGRRLRDLPPTPAPSPSLAPSPIPVPSLSPEPSPGVDASTPRDAAALQASPTPEAPAAAPSPRLSRRERNEARGARAQEGMRRVRMPEAAFRLIDWGFTLLIGLESLGIATFLFLIPVTYALVRIEYEQHWYIVTDRSLRIRTGVLSLSEATMSFTNLQQVEVKQGPIQRLLGLADVRVRSAGGGSDHETGHTDPLHTGVFRDVENADLIRDLIVDRLRQFRETGLGDAEPRARPGAREEPAISAFTLDAARELAEEARGFRHAVERLRDVSAN